MTDRRHTNHRVAYVDGRGALEVDLFRSDGDEPSERPVIMVGLTPAQPTAVYFALDAAEARTLAAELVAMADDLDAGRWPDVGEPGV